MTEQRGCTAAWRAGNEPVQVVFACVLRLSECGVGAQYRALGYGIRCALQRTVEAVRTLAEHSSDVGCREFPMTDALEAARSGTAIAVAPGEGRRG